MKVVKGTKLELNIHGSKMSKYQQDIWEKDYGGFPVEGNSVIVTDIRADGWLQIKCAYPNHIRQFWPPEYFKEAEQLPDEPPAPDGWVRPPVTGSLLLLELMQVVEYVDKPNGGSVAYLRHDAVVNKLNALLNMPLPQPPKQ